MQLDSFITNNHAHTRAFNRWFMSSLFLIGASLTIAIVLYNNALQDYNQCNHSCASCEKIATTLAQKNGTPLSKEYAQINEQAALVRSHTATYHPVTALAATLLRNTVSPVTLQALTLNETEHTIVYRTPLHHPINTITNQLTKEKSEHTFHLTRYEQHDTYASATFSAKPHTHTQHMQTKSN